MNQNEDRTLPHEGTGAKGGKEALKRAEQQALGIEPDSNVDEKLRESGGPPPGGLNPDSIVRNA